MVSQDNQTQVYFCLEKKLAGSTSASNLEKTYLQKLLYEDENLWEFEVNSAVRSNSLSFNVLGVYKHA